MTALLIYFAIGLVLSIFTVASIIADTQERIFWPKIRLVCCFFVILLLWPMMCFMAILEKIDNENNR